MKPKTRRTLKKVFLNVTAGLFALIFTGNVIAGENAGQINQVLGTKTSETISTLPAGQEEGYARYFESNFSSIAELKNSTPTAVTLPSSTTALKSFSGSARVELTFMQLAS